MRAWTQNWFQQLFHLCLLEFLHLSNLAYMTCYLLLVVTGNHVNEVNFLELGAMSRRTSKEGTSGRVL